MDPSDNQIPTLPPLATGPAALTASTSTSTSTTMENHSALAALAASAGEQDINNVDASSNADDIVNATATVTVTMDTSSVEHNDNGLTAAGTGTAALVSLSLPLPIQVQVPVSVPSPATVQDPGTLHNLAAVSVPVQMPVMITMPPLPLQPTVTPVKPPLAPTDTDTDANTTAATGTVTDTDTASVPKSSRKQQARMDGIWYKHLQELKRYKEVHGTVSVPRKSGQLGEWCRTQRRYYRMYRKGETVPLTKERMKALEALGFVWFPAEERKKRKREASLKALVKGDPSLGIHADSIGIGVGVGGNLKMEYKMDVDVDANANTNPANRNTAQLLLVNANQNHSYDQDSNQDANNAPLSKKQKIHSTAALTIAHGTYNKSIRALHTANEKLCDAQDLLENAMQAHQQALERQKQATVQVNVACDAVLDKELKDNEEDEWNSFYKQLNDYKQENGEILFAKNIPSEKGGGKVSAEAGDVETMAGTTTSTTTVNPEDVGIVIEAAEGMRADAGAGADAPAVAEGASLYADAAAAAAADIVNEISSDIATTPDGGVQADTGQAESLGEASAASRNDEGEKGSDSGDEKASNDKTLPEWVCAMRKAPKKSISEWRHKALDKLGFIWNQYDAIWTARYRELVDYREKNGNTQVPTSFPVLGVWVGTQRKQYRLKQKGKYSHMTDERMAMLNSIGFVWEVNTWNEKFEELKQFHAEHGHFLVPTEFPNKQLRPWISTQRSHFRFKQENKASQMTDERIQLLNSIGFPWKTKEDWQTRFNELILFFHEHGNLQVPRVYEKAPKLYRWVNCQKMEFQKHLMEQGSRLKADQIKMLENIGFEQV